jgi:hypothetical protein
MFSAVTIARAINEHKTILINKIIKVIKLIFILNKK